jgi:hypothetical protein
VRREKDLRSQLKKKSEEPSSSSAIQAEQSNQDEQEEVTEDNNNSVTERTPLPEPAPRFANTVFCRSKREAVGQAGSDFGGNDLKKD